MESQINSIIVDKVEAMFNIAKEIVEEDKVIGEVFLMNIINSMDIINAKVKSETLDLSDKLKTISDVLNIDLEELVKMIIEKHYSQGQGGDFISNEDAEKDVVDFIINNTKNIDDYEKFLQENSVKENLDYLKENL